MTELITPRTPHTPPPPSGRLPAAVGILIHVWRTDPSIAVNTLDHPAHSAARVLVDAAQEYLRLIPAADQAVDKAKFEITGIREAMHRYQLRHLANTAGIIVDLHSVNVLIGLTARLITQEDHIRNLARAYRRALPPCPHDRRRDMSCESCEAELRKDATRIHGGPAHMSDAERLVVRELHPEHPLLLTEAQSLTVARIAQGF